MVGGASVATKKKTNIPPPSSSLYLNPKLKVLEYTASVPYHMST